MTAVTPMQNHWSTFGSSLVLWYAEFMPAVWDRWNPLEHFTRVLLALGRAEDVFVADGKLLKGRHRNLLGGMAGRSRVAVHGWAGLEERFTNDLGCDLLELRPDLRQVARVPAVTLEGPIRPAVDGPVYFSAGLGTDIWFSRLAGVNEIEDGDISYDNSILAARHTPRLNRFLVGIRAAAEAAGARWDYDVGSHQFYGDLVDRYGVRDR
ncbi:hypothetical protein OG474_00700 [Kribbella sp. NBC_01505]|uniref:hypothetical protein n=1 Tax=Kribbella sp. NBC_01505 TaxID=2903580 RepID=UPI003869681C